MDILLFGMQGSGKGTLAKVIAKTFGFEIFEMGSELRKLSNEDSDLGKKVKTIVESGNLVSDEVVMDIVENYMKNLPSEKNIIFDGIPRKKGQAQSLDDLMKKMGRDFKGILVNIPEEVAIKRLSSRRICSVCKTVYPANYEKENCEKCGGTLTKRSDDNPESIKNRLEAYQKETMPVIDRYKQEGKLMTMNGNQSMEDAAKEILEIVEKEIKI